MRTHRWISAFTVAAALSLGACGDPGEGSREAGSLAQPGATQATDESDQPAGYSPEKDQGTAVNDTTPHRPGAAGTATESPGSTGARATTSNTGS
jgi:hypothetical protein